MVSYRPVLAAAADTAAISVSLGMRSWVLLLSASRATCLQGCKWDDLDGTVGRALEGQPLLAAVTRRDGCDDERYHGRRPASGKAPVAGSDPLASLLGGVYIEAERTMIELQPTTVVQHARSAF